MRVLLVDNHINHDSWGAPELTQLFREVSSETLVIRRAPEGDLPTDPSRYHRIIVSGSKTRIQEKANWIQKLDGFLLHSIEVGIPILGICYGHQALVRAVSGERHLGLSKPGELGWTKMIRTHKDDTLFHTVPREFYSFSSHFDEVLTLPDQFEHLCRSEKCDIQAIQLKERPVFGIQFHPEKDLVTAEKTFREFHGKRRKKGNRGDYLQILDGRRVFHRETGKTILKNFLCRV